MNNIPSSLVVGTTNVTVPLIDGMKSTFNDVEDDLGGVGTAYLVIAIIGMASAGLVIGLSVLAFCMRRPRLLGLAALALTNLAATCFFILAVAITGAVDGGTSALGGLGDAVTIDTTRGKRALALLWVSWVFSLVPVLYWTTVWFVELRNTAFKRRRRTDDEIGSYTGIFSEVRRDLRLDPVPKA